MAFQFLRFTAADRPLYNSLCLDNPLKTFSYPDHWAVDGDRNAIFVEFGGRGDLAPEEGQPPTFHALVWNGKVITLGSHHRSSFPTPTQQVITHRLSAIFPTSLKGHEPEIEVLIADGLVAYQSQRKFPAYKVETTFGQIDYR